jgi:hypothetical protein
MADSKHGDVSQNKHENNRTVSQNNARGGPTRIIEQQENSLNGSDKYSWLKSRRDLEVTQNNKKRQWM